MSTQTSGNLIERIGYISETIQSWSTSEILELTTSSQKRNTKLNITGILLVGSNYFIQILEGEPKNLLPLIEKIGLDKRHQNLRIFSSYPDNTRLSNDWMAVIETEKLSPHAQSDLIEFKKRIEQNKITNSSLTEADIAFLRSLASPVPSN